MDFIWFNFFSTIEVVGMFCLMLALFRFRIKEYIFHMIFASFLLSQTSYYMREHFELANYVPIVFVIFTFLFVWLMFRVQLFYAAVMAVTGYIALIILQGAIIFIGISLNLFQLDDIGPTWLGYILQLITFLTSLFISWLLIRKRIGFTFVPFSETLQVKFRGENIFFLIIVLIGIIVAGIYLYWGLKSFYSFLFVILLLVCYFSSLVYLAIRREKQDD
jgi:hypothetical protein